MNERPGAHAQLLVRRWSPRLSRDILASWLDLLNSQGWIAREQVPTRSDPRTHRSSAPMNLVLQGLFLSRVYLLNSQVR